MPANMLLSIAQQLGFSAAARLHHTNYTCLLAANPGACCRSLTDLGQHQPEGTPPVTVPGASLSAQKEPHLPRREGHQDEDHGERDGDAQLRLVRLQVRDEVRADRRPNDLQDVHMHAFNSWSM